ncbi:RNA polymerase sigma factor [Saccharicrinis fermentans]|uniref:RNA polymerase sigma factor n=1 Tax=Saccharicrinis fermentans DSM 9555 = JCM 21142 TaxID=869213 RepID=W7YSR6_9BACT|nr:RNA polymerase sigma-70 factor [Saccharicrinis fermentans]GAF05504.1 RNA polymerase sigma factor [Saccharicrinis fermentans DSM 9555 = JCM 21142]
MRHRLLLDKIQQGDSDTFTDLFNEYWEQLYLFSFNILKDEGLAKDVVQDVFISIWNRRGELQISNLKSYLFQSVKFQAAKTIRDHLNLRIYADVYENIESNASNNVENEINYKELCGVVEQSMHKLPKKCAEVFYLSRHEGLSNLKVAEQLNISISTVENQINKALRIIKKDMHDYCLLLMVMYVLK